MAWDSFVWPYWFSIFTICSEIPSPQIKSGTLLLEELIYMELLLLCLAILDCVNVSIHVSVHCYLTANFKLSLVYVISN